MSVSELLHKIQELNTQQDAAYDSMTKSLAKIASSIKKMKKRYKNSKDIDQDKIKFIDNAFQELRTVVDNHNKKHKHHKINPDLYELYNLENNALSKDLGASSSTIYNDSQLIIPNNDYFDTMDRI